MVMKRTLNCIKGVFVKVSELRVQEWYNNNKFPLNRSSGSLHYICLVIHVSAGGCGTVSAQRNK